MAGNRPENATCSNNVCTSDLNRIGIASFEAHIQFGAFLSSFLAGRGKVPDSRMRNNILKEESNFFDCAGRDPPGPQAHDLMVAFDESMLRDELGRKRMRL